MTTPATIFASSPGDITLDRVRQLVDQNLPEGLTLEYKEAYTSNLVRSVAAMANSYGGIVLVGVKDSAEADRLVGVGEEVIVQIINACHDSLEPPWEPEIVPLPLGNEGNRMILVVRVDPARAPRPLLLNGTAPIRLQGRNAIADRSRLAALFSEVATTAPGTRQVLPQPTLPTKSDGSADADFILRTGFWLPLGEAAGWRPLPESGVDRLKEALNRSALGRMLSGWAGRFGVSGLNPFDRRGLNRARRARLVWQAVPSIPDRYPVEAVAQLTLPESVGAPAASASFTVDVIVRVRDVMEQSGAPAAMSEWHLGVAPLYETLDGLVGGLVDPDLIRVLADIAGIDPIVIDQPLGAHFITGPTVGDLLHPVGLTPITDAGTSHGAHLVSEPALDLSSGADRHRQVDAWVLQIALDAGLRGMEGVLNELKRLGNPPFGPPQ